MKTIKSKHILRLSVIPLLLPLTGLSYTFGVSGSAGTAPKINNSSKVTCLPGGGGKMVNGQCQCKPGYTLSSADGLGVCWQKEKQ